ncbi:MAG: DNA repair protein RecN [Ignavibacteriales bacterium]|nr:DNA repair protein RecN [Ignavibacteriales bacterium]
MLATLYIKNYALIEAITVHFRRGLNIITGETGAGKSIIIDALSLLLGERASTDVVRKGAEKAIVEGVFDLPELPRLKPLLLGHEIDSGAELIVRREISSKGQSRCFVNDTPVSVSVLKEIGDVLVDLHGQHDHQSLLRPETHIDFLDEYGSYRGLLEEYALAFRTLTALISEKRRLLVSEARIKEKKDLYEFQMAEIDAVAPTEGEEEALEAELKILENAEKLVESTARLNEILYEAESAVHDQLVQARKLLETLHGIDAAFGDSLGELRSAEIIIEELAKFVQKYNANIEFNPAKLDEMRDRLGRLAMLKKKYGGTLAAVLSHRRKIGEELALAENFDAEIAKTEKAIEDARIICAERARKLTVKRKETAKKITASVLEGLSDLGIATSLFDVRIDSEKANGADGAFVSIASSRVVAGPNGVDTVEFFLSTNAGEDVKPLAKVASGGEVSRVMLALKSALAASDKTPLLIFDEIDVGVSGKVGQSVGRSLKKLASSHQVIAITHLPQIAALADAHFAVEKGEQNGRTATRLRELSETERVHEVAKLLSGAAVTEAGLESAKELMAQ